MKKTFKTLLALLMVLTLVCALFVPVFADDADASGDDATEEPTEKPTDAEPTESEDEGGEDNDCIAGDGSTEIPACPPPTCPTTSGGEDTCDEWCFVWTPCVEFIKDYSKLYVLGYVTLGECSVVKAYILYEDGSIFNANVATRAEKAHHGQTVYLLWNGLDDNGTHPAGTWNNPTQVRLSVILLATCINGHDHVATAWFNYCYYDTLPEKAASAAPAAPAGGAPAGKSNDVPHTGL